MRGLAACAAWLLAATPALGCPVPAPEPVPVELPGGSGSGPGVLHLPPGWERGDAAALVVDAEAFRLGCRSARTAALLEAGLLVLALPPQVSGGGERIEAGLVLRDGFGAGSVAALWPGLSEMACEAVMGGAARACRRVRG